MVYRHSVLTSTLSTLKLSIPARNLICIFIARCILIMFKISFTTILVFVFNFVWKLVFDWFMTRLKALHLFYGATRLADTVLARTSINASINASTTRMIRFVPPLRNIPINNCVWVTPITTDQPHEATMRSRTTITIVVSVSIALARYPSLDFSLAHVRNLPQW